MKKSKELISVSYTDRNYSDVPGYSLNLRFKTKSQMQKAKKLLSQNMPTFEG